MAPLRLASMNLAALKNFHKLPVASHALQSERIQWVSCRIASIRSLRGCSTVARMAPMLKTEDCHAKHAQQHQPERNCPLAIEK